MTRPRLLDLFSGAGGSAVGYHRAGFDVTGVDIAPMPNYPYTFHQGDALEYLAEHGHEYDAIHASPPCQAYSVITADRSKHPRLIAPVRIMLRYFAKPYVIENVEGAQRELIHPVRLCGSSFGLAVRRHRYFETSTPMMSVPCDHVRQGTPVGVYGDHAEAIQHIRPTTGTSRAVKARDLAHARESMGIDWMTWDELTQAIPPQFTAYIGEYLLEALEVAA